MVVVGVFFCFLASASSLRDAWINFFGEKTNEIYALFNIFTFLLVYPKEFHSHDKQVSIDLHFFKLTQLYMIWYTTPTRIDVGFGVAILWQIW